MLRIQRLCNNNDDNHNIAIHILYKYTILQTLKHGGTRRTQTPQFLYTQTWIYSLRNSIVHASECQNRCKNGVPKGIFNFDRMVLFRETKKKAILLSFVFFFYSLRLVVQRISYYKRI